jgi:hypothetical protein
MGFLTEPITLQSLFGPKRTIGTITVQVLKEERTTDRLTITKHPVQQGAPVVDHAFREPVEYSCTMLFKDSLFGPSLNQIYQNLQDLQNSRTPFNINTPKRTYSNMLMTALGNITDTGTNNCLSIQASFSEVILVPVSQVTVPAKRQRNAAKTRATQNAGKKSALLNLSEAASGAISGIKAGLP